MMPYRWINWLKGHFVIKSVFFLLPAFFSVISCTFYVAELLSTFEVLSINNALVQQRIELERIAELDMVGSDKAIASTGNIFDTYADMDGYAGELSYNEEKDRFYFTVGYGSIFTDQLDFAERVEGGILIDDKLLTGSWFCTIKYHDKVFTLEFQDGDVLEITDSINMKWNGKYISYTSDIIVSDLNLTDVVVTTSLPSDNYFYDLDSGVVIKNAGKDFCKNYILGTKVVLLFASVTMLSIFMELFNKRFELLGSEKKRYSIVNAFGCLLVVFVILFMFLLLC